MIGDAAYEDRHRAYFSVELADASKILPIVDMRRKVVEDMRKQISLLLQGSVLHALDARRQPQNFLREAILKSLATKFDTPILMDIETWLGKGVWRLKPPTFLPDQRFWQTWGSKYCIEEVSVTYL